MTGHSAQPGVLVVGDANPDLILTGDVVPRFGQTEQLLDGADIVLGGSAAIVASGLARLGIRTALAAVVGADDLGRLVRRLLDERGVRTDWVIEDAVRPTGLSVILDQHDDRAILTLAGTIPCLGADHVRSAVEAFAPAHVHVASYFLQPQLAADLPDLLIWLRGLGISTSLDTNWDPSERWAGVAAVLPLVDVLLPNAAEVVAIATALGHRVDGADQAARALTGYGCRVVVKAGSAGAQAYELDGTVSAAPGLTVDVRDTTGAGDSFDAGYLAAVVSGVDDPVERVRCATVAGSLSTRGRGGTGCQATMDEVRQRVAR